MTTNLTKELAAIQERADAATPGPWQAWRSGEVTDVPANPEDRFDVMPMTLFKAVETDEDANFIAHARTDVEWMARALQAVVELHQPMSGGLGMGPCCQECSGDHGADSTKWPCPTIRAIEQALEVGNE